MEIVKEQPVAPPDSATGVKLSICGAMGVPEPVSSIVFKPVDVKTPEPENLYPLTVLVEME
jgi:hypothetical protein